MRAMGRRNKKCLMKSLFYGVAMGIVLASSSVQAADGQAVYEQNCAGCHRILAPKLGDKAAWADRITLGTNALVASTIKGKGSMPARGGKPNLSDDDIKAAVEYIESKSR